MFQILVLKKCYISSYLCLRDICIWIYRGISYCGMCIVLRIVSPGAWHYTPLMSVFIWLCCLKIKSKWIVSWSGFVWSFNAADFTLEVKCYNKTWHTAPKFHFLIDIVCFSQIFFLILTEDEEKLHTVVWTIGNIFYL